jgi:hypothetical protein
LGKNYKVYLQKGKKKLYVNSIFWENCMILNKFSFGKPYNGPCYRREKSPASTLKNSAKYTCISIRKIRMYLLKEELHHSMPLLFNT